MYFRHLDKISRILFACIMLIGLSQFALATDVTNNLDDPSNPNAPGTFRNAYLVSSSSNRVVFNLPQDQQTIFLQGDLSISSTPGVIPPATGIVRIIPNGSKFFYINNDRYVEVTPGIIYYGSTGTPLNVSTFRPLSLNRVYNSYNENVFRGYAHVDGAQTSDVAVNIHDFSRVITKENASTVTNSRALLRLEGGGFSYSSPLSANLTGVIKDINISLIGTQSYTIGLGFGATLNSVAPTGKVDLHIENVTSLVEGLTAIGLGGAVRTINMISGEFGGNYINNKMFVRGKGDGADPNITQYNNGNIQSVGGALYVFSGGIQNLTANFIGNHALATQIGSGVIGKGVSALGGAVFSTDDTNINGGSFIGNTVEVSGTRGLLARGGAIYVDASGTLPTKTTPLQVSLTNNGSDILFYNNRTIENGIVEYNDIHIGQEYFETPHNSGRDAIVTVAGNTVNSNNSISIMGGIKTNLNSGKNLTFNRAIGTGQFHNQFFWGGLNILSTSNVVLNNNGTAVSGNTPGSYTTVNLTSGTTHLLNDFNLTTTGGDGDTELINLVLGANHALSVSTQGRRSNLPFFDLQSAKSANFTVEQGTKIIAPSFSNVPMSGEYLLVNGTSGNVDLSLFDIEDKPNFQVSLFQRGRELWIRQLYLPMSMAMADDNTGRAFNAGALAYIISNNNSSNARLMSDLRSITPEAAVTSALINRSTHLKVISVAEEQHGLIKNDYQEARNQFNYLENLDRNRKYSQLDDTDLFSNSHKIGFARLSSSQVSSYERQNLARMFQATSSQMNFASQNLGVAESSLASLSPFKVWTGYVGSFTDMEDKKGYSGYNSSTNGFLSGVSYITNSWKHSAYAGYTNTFAKFKNSAKDYVDSFHTGFLSTYSYDDFDFTFNGAYSHSRNTLKRNPGKTGVSESKYGQDFYSVGLEVRYNLPTESFNSSVFASVNQVWLSQDKIKESGGLTTSKVDSFDEQGAITELGVSFDKNFELSESYDLRPFVHASWKRNFGENQYETSSHFIVNSNASPSYNLESIEEGTDILKVGTGLNFSVKPGNDGIAFDVVTSYDYEYSSKKDDHTIYGGIKFSF